MYDVKIINLASTFGNDYCAPITLAQIFCIETNIIAKWADVLLNKLEEPNNLNE